jgi:hypothetical protein
MKKLFSSTIPIKKCLAILVLYSNYIVFYQLNVLLGKMGDQRAREASDKFNYTSYSSAQTWRKKEATLGYAIIFIDFYAVETLPLLASRWSRR